MTTELSISKHKDQSPLDIFMEWYEGCVPIRVGTAALAPITHGITALIDIGLTSSFSFVRQTRLKALKDELTYLDLHPTEEEIKSQDFLEAFLAVASRTEQTKRVEKIKLFAALFASYWRKGDFSSKAYDSYEEDLKIIDELGYHEFVILSILYTLEAETKHEKGDNELNFARRFWSDFEAHVGSQLAFSPEELQGHLQRLARTGLYQPIVGAYLGYGGGLGRLTTRFSILKDRIAKAVAHS